MGAPILCGAAKLEVIDIPESVTKIAETAFKKTGITL